jgi:cell division protein YceG involved in septum cleavage
MRNESSTVSNRVYHMSDSASSHMRSDSVSNNRRMVVRRQKIALTSIALIAIIMIICIFLFGAIHTQAAPSEISCKYYTSIEVKSGDTLWSIASEHITDDYDDMNDYINEVCSINKISQNEIHAGQYITIPYYSSVTVAEN